MHMMAGYDDWMRWMEMMDGRAGELTGVSVKACHSEASDGRFDVFSLNTSSP